MHWLIPFDYYYLQTNKTMYQSEDKADFFRRRVLVKNKVRILTHEGENSIIYQKTFLFTLRNL